MAVGRLIVSLALVALFFAAGPSARAQSDIGIERIVQIFASQDIPAGIFSEKTLQNVPIEKLEQSISLLELAAGNYKGVARSPEAPIDPRLSPFSHYVVTFSAATVDVYLHFDDDRLIDGILLLPPKPTPFTQQSSDYIKPPKNWVRTNISESFSSVGVAELFFSPEQKGPFRQNIDVYVVPTESKSLKSAIEQMMKRIPLKLLHQEETPRQCGRFQAANIAGEEQLPNGMVGAFRGVVVLANLKIYGATYTRAKDQAEITDAVDAINSLCDNPRFGGLAFK